MTLTAHTKGRGLDEIAADLERDCSREELPAVLARVLEEATVCYRQNQQAGGLYDDVRSLAPGLDPELRRLAGRHRQILGRLAEIVRELDARPAGPWLGAIRKGLVRMMLEQGRAERDAVLEAYLRDLGGG